MIQYVSVCFRLTRGSESLEAIVEGADCRLLTPRITRHEELGTETTTQPCTNNFVFEFLGSLRSNCTSFWAAQRAIKACNPQAGAEAKQHIARRYMPEHFNDSGMRQPEGKTFSVKI